MSTAKTLSCPHCRGEVANDPRLAGRKVQCPHCQKQFLLAAPPPVRAVPPIAANQPAPASTEQPLRLNTATKQKRSDSVPVWAWILGGFGLLIMFCCGGPVVISAITEPQRRAERQAIEKRLAAELPNNATGLHWTKASREAKSRFVEKFGPSWTSMNHSEVIGSVDFHYEWAEKNPNSGNRVGDLVRAVIDKVVASKKKEQKDNMREFWANRAAQEKDPKMRQEYLRRYREE